MSPLGPDSSLPQVTFAIGKTTEWSPDCNITAVTTEETLQILNDLTETCKDGELGYRTAAENVNNTQMETILSDYSKQRAGFARQLQAEVARLGGTPTDAGTLSATVFRGWIHLKAALSGGDVGAIIAACESGEESAVGAFEIAKDADLTGLTRSIVEKQFSQIKAAHAHIMKIQEDASKADFQKND
jgi:uncharacterized protein (TIGR02284 family)